MAAQTYAIDTPGATETRAVEQIWVAGHEPESAGAWRDNVQPLGEWASRLRVLTVGGRVVGGYGYRRERASQEGWIRATVLPEYRSEELVGALLDDALQLGQRDGGSGIRLPVRGIQQWVEPIARGRGFRTEQTVYFMTRPANAPTPVRRVVPGIDIRPMRNGEEAAVLAALNRAWATTAHFEPITADHLEQDLEDQRGGMLLGVEQAGSGPIVATCHAVSRPGESDADGRTWGWISNLTSLPEWRGRGIGRAMLTAGLLYLYQQWPVPVGLGVDGDSQGAIGLYESMGFVISDRLVVWAIDVGQLAA